MNPSLDVVIPCYNAESTLTAAVESAAAQTCVNTIWLVDDASQDNTLNVMKQLKARFPNVEIECLAENGGAAKARNWGALQSQADFVAFLDADDRYQPQTLAPAFFALNKFSYIGLVRLKLIPAGFPAHYLQHAEFQTAWTRMQMTVGGNTVFRRDLLLAAGGFPQDALFKQFGGEDAALGIAFTRSSVSATLFAEENSGVEHVYRPGIHAERLLDTALFGAPLPEITSEHLAQAEAVTQRICNRLERLRQTVQHTQRGIMTLNVSYG